MNQLIYDQWHFARPALTKHYMKHLNCWRRRMTRLANGRFGVTRRYSCPTTRRLTHSPYGSVCRAQPTIGYNSPATSWRSACRGKGTRRLSKSLCPIRGSIRVNWRTAATLAMEEAGLEFRATKDLDIVLHIEALNAEFATAFWVHVLAAARSAQENASTNLTSPPYPRSTSVPTRSFSR